MDDASEQRTRSASGEVDRSALYERGNAAEQGNAADRE